jgi:hypothetical protein
MADVVHDMELELVQREMITKSKDAIIEHLREDVYVNDQQRACCVVPNQ